MVPLEDGNTGIENDEQGARVENNRLAVESVAVPAGAGASNLFGGLLENGGSSDMVVDGSGAPIVFSIVADPALDAYLTTLRVVFVAGTIDWGLVDFGSGADLTNGILLEVFVGGIAYTIGNLQVNEDFLQLPAVEVMVEPGGSNDVLAVTVQVCSQLVLTAGSADVIRATVRDDLTVPSRGVKYLKIGAVGYTRA